MENINLWEIFGEKFDLWLKIRFLAKNSIFGEKFNF